MRFDRFQKIAAALMGVLVLISFALANVQSFVWQHSEWLVATILPAVVISETNDARSAAALPPLTRSPLLDEAAQLKAEDMAARSYFSHNSPDGRTPWYWYREVGYQYQYAGENLAVHFTDSEAVVDAWLKSPSHRANVMNGDYTEIGIGTAKGTFEGFDTVFVVQLFGTPVSATVPEPVLSQPRDAVQIQEPVQALQVLAQAEEETVEPQAVPAATEEPVTEAVMVSETGAGTVVYESFAATETPGMVLAEETSEAQDLHVPVSFMDRLMTSPSQALQVAYIGIGTIVVMLLAYSLIFEWRRHHPKQIAYSIALLLCMIGLFALHSFILKSAIVA
jgi:hypothetical protein